jgi:ubiquinone/menaquinone biosynthesis C-methylase UbiE
MADLTAYHLTELEVIRNPADPRRQVPDYDCTGWDVLDVGCGIGQTLSAHEFAAARSRHGIDVDSQAITVGREMFPQFTLQVASAEKIPYPDGHFHLVFSRVALPYTNVPVALAEILRVTKAGGAVWLLMHSWGLERTAWLEAARRLRLRRLLDRTYVLANSLTLAATGRCFARPWSHTYESFQFAPSMMRLLRGMSFCDVRCPVGEQLCISARKAAAP